MNSRLHLLLFLVSIFILTAIGVVVVYVGTANPIFWFVYIVVYLCGFASYLPFLEREAKLNWKKILLLVFSTTIIAIAVTNSVWTIITPKWSFSVSTDKSTYRLGENVTITVSLRNMGFITHSFKSSVSNPVVVMVCNDDPVLSATWWSGYNRSITEFSLGPNDSFERDFIWNQTNLVSPEWKQVSPGRYYVIASIPDESDFIDPLGMHNIFFAYTSINITST